MEKIKLSEKVTNEEFLILKGHNRTHLNNIVRRKPNWVVHFPGINYLIHDANEGQMTEMKVVLKSFLMI